MKALLVAGVAALASCGAPRSDRTASTTITVTHVSVAPATVNYDGQQVQAGPDHQYVLLDCRIDAPPNEVDLDDFQLVRDSTAELGHETNVGNNDDDDYFYSTYLDASGQPVEERPVEPGPFMARLAFKVPTNARQGYLFNAGRYWGPFEFR